MTDSNIGNLTERVLGGKYKLLSLLGKGGMSAVYKAQHLLLNKIFAVKIMHAKHIADSNAVLRFRQEAAAAMSLSHPNIITVWDFAIEGDQPYQVIDYLEGTSLHEEIERNERLPLERAVHIWIQVCEGLGHAHSKGIIHRDLKPSNIMLTVHDGDRDFVKIVDFGIAKVLPQEGEAIHRLTQTGEVFGSPFYMSPEQCMGRALDARADVYSMGCLMYETIAGTPPFMGAAVFQTVQMHMDAMPPSVKPYVKDAATATRLDYIICKAMAKAPGERYQSLEELRADLLQIAKGQKQNPIASVGQQLGMLRLKWTQLMRNKPARLLGAVIPVMIILGCLAATPVLRFASARIPDFEAPASPLFTVEFEPGQKDPVLNAERQWQVGLGQIRNQLDQVSYDIKARAKVARDAAVIEAQSGTFDQAAGDADQLRQLLLKLPKKDRSLVDEAAPDRARAMVDYTCIADGCYFAKPSDTNRSNGLFFYELASEQLADAAPRMLRRIYMKMADLKLRPKEATGRDFTDVAQAEDLLQKAGGGDTSNFPMAQVMMAKRDDRAIYDRAAYFWKIGEACQMLKQYSQSTCAYEGSAAEWHKLGESEREALCNYLAAITQMERIKGGDSSPKLLLETVDNLNAALRYYSTRSQPDHVKLANIYAKLADVQMLRKDYPSWLDAQMRSRFEAAAI